MYFMADMPAIRLARASQSPRRATYGLMHASKLIRITFDKSNKRASGAGDTSRTANVREGSYKAVFRA